MWEGRSLEGPAFSFPAPNTTYSMIASVVIATQWMARLSTIALWQRRWASSVVTRMTARSGSTKAHREGMRFMRMGAVASTPKVRWPSTAKENASF